MDELDDLIRSTVEAMNKRFDSHELILHLAQHNQRHYIKALRETEGNRPFKKLHARIGRRVKALSDQLGIDGQPWKSADIFGQASDCVLYTKR